MSQQYGESLAKEKFYFYESPSKYISLKKFSEELFQFSDMGSEKGNPQNNAKGKAETMQSNPRVVDNSPKIIASSSEQGYSLY